VKKILIVLLASLIGMLLCSGIASAFMGDCCTCEGGALGDFCACISAGDEGSCDGIWMGAGGCTPPDCEYICDDGGNCVPEITTIALLVTGLICMAGYFRLRRREK